MNSYIFLKIIVHSTLFYNVFAAPHDSANWKINIVHTNDMHARFEETNAMSAICSEDDKKKNACYGGFPRISTLVKKARNSNLPALFLNAGDTYQGTIWFNKYQGEIVTKFLNILKPDVATLGNHEFDLGPEGLAPYVKNAAFPIVTCNLDFSQEPVLAETNMTKSYVLTVNNKKIGVIGYLTPITKTISSTGKVIFHDEIESIKAEINKLKAEGVKIFIGLGHSGYDVDKKIAAAVEDIDLIIGGHSHSFLYSGKSPDKETPAGLYPTEIIQKSGRKVYVVQAYAFTKYMGNLFIDFDANGEIIEIKGRPILVDHTVEQDPYILEELEKWRPGLDLVYKKPIGFTKVFLNGARELCRQQECNMGNLIVDAMVDYYQTEYGGDDGWTDAAIAIHNSGSVRTSIAKKPNEPITFGDIMMVLPFGNVVGKTTVTGYELFQILEHSIAEHKKSTKVYSGQFLHFSGLQVAYDISKRVGKKVLLNSVWIRCAKCKEPAYKKLQLNGTYTIIATNFIFDGGNGYSMFKEYGNKWISSGLTTAEIVADYISKIKYSIHLGAERRIKFINWSDCKERNKRRSRSNVNRKFFDRRNPRKTLRYPTQSY